MAETYTQIDHDGPQHIDGAAPPPVAVPVTVPESNISKAMPPQEVMDAAMLLTEACTGWEPTPLPKPDINVPPQEPIMHNQSYVLHQDLCSLATDPVGFKEGVDDVFGYGMFFAVILMALFWGLFKVFMWGVSLFQGRKERSAELLKRRLLVKTAKAKLDANANRVAGAAE